VTLGVKEAGLQIPVLTACPAALRETESTYEAVLGGFYETGKILEFD